MHVSYARLILKGRQPSLLRTYWRAIRYPLEASSSLFSETFQIPCQSHRSLPSIAAISLCYPVFSGHLRNLVTTVCCDTLTCERISTSHFQYRSLSLHQQWPDQDHQPAHLMPLDLQLPRCSITIFRENRMVVTILFFFVVFHHNPSFSVLGPTIIAGHETVPK